MVRLYIPARTHHSIGMQGPDGEAAKLAKVKAMVHRLLDQAVSADEIPPNTSVYLLKRAVRTLAKRGKRLDESQRIDEQVGELQESLKRRGGSAADRLSEQLDNHLKRVRTPVSPSHVFYAWEAILQGGLPSR